ncbi:MAG: type II toxin-antitoxin system VapC family toxin [Verrucomicrobiota bacterium]
MKLLVLDTNAYSDYQRFGRWQWQLQRAERVLVPVVVLAELKFGFLSGALAPTNRSVLQLFLNERRISVLLMTERTSDVYADFKTQLKRQGTPIPENDIWIAAMCYEVGGTLASADSHFRHLPQLSQAVE